MLTGIIMGRIISGIRAVLLKCRFGELHIPSLFAKPIKLRGVKHAYIGKRFRILNGARFEICDEGKLYIGEDVSVGQNFHIVSGGNETLTIGSHVTISGNVFISNMNHSYEKINVHSYEQEHIAKQTSIGDYCFIGYGAVILPGTILGKNVIVGANSVVHGEFPDYVVIAGNPAKIIKYYDMEKQKWIKK